MPAPSHSVLPDRRRDHAARRSLGSHIRPNASVRLLPDADHPPSMPTENLPHGRSDRRENCAAGKANPFFHLVVSRRPSQAPVETGGQAPAAARRLSRDSTTPALARAAARPARPSASWLTRASVTVGMHEISHPAFQLPPTGACPDEVRAYLRWAHAATLEDGGQGKEGIREEEKAAGHPAGSGPKGTRSTAATARRRRCHGHPHHADLAGHTDAAPPPPHGREDGLAAAVVARALPGAETLAAAREGARGRRGRRDLGLSPPSRSVRKSLSDSGVL
jgi:hypothetical protein